MNALNFLSSPVTNALGWTLLHAVWQGFALVLPVAVILHLLRDRSSALRYRIGTLTLLSQLLLSAITFMWYYNPTTNTLVPKAASTGAYILPIRWQVVSQTLPWPQQMQLFLENHLSQFVLIYLIGVALFGLRLAGGWLYLQRLTKTAIQPSTTIWMQFTEQLRSTLSIQTRVQVRESSRITVPMVVGVLKPVLLLPVALVTNLTTREIEAILAHELAHIKRHDYAVNLLQSVVEVLYFFHPALWWLSARVREEREHCCDDLAVKACGGDGRILAQALAHVEELRLAHVRSAPTLAMALSTNRQQLLHRIRRMLGVPSRPFISNGSLAGLALATLLLMSVSVYAVQKQDKPKHKISRPRPVSTRTHKVDGNSEYEMVDNQKISHIIWKGHKLSTVRVQKLQTKLDQVMAGQLSLDDVAQPDRDILLTIIEKNNAFDQGMGALANGLSHIDYSNIVASALSNVPLSPDGTVEGLAKVNYNNIIKDAFASLAPLKSLSDSLDKQRLYRQRQMDSLSQLMAQRSKQMQAIQLQMEKFRFPIEELQRNQEVLNWRKDKLMEQRNMLIEKHQKLLSNDGKQKLSLDDVEKQVAALEPAIKKLESNMEALNQQFEAINAKEEEVKLPIEKLERESQQLEEQINKLSEEMDRQGDGMAGMFPEDVKIDLENELHHTPRRVHTPRSPKLPKGVVVSAAPLAPLHAVPAPPAPAIAPTRSRAATPRAMPKPAVAPKPE